MKSRSGFIHHDNIVYNIIMCIVVLLYCCCCRFGRRVRSVLSAQKHTHARLRMSATATTSAYVGDCLRWPTADDSIIHQCYNVERKHNAHAYNMQQLSVDTLCSLTGWLRYINMLGYILTTTLYKTLNA